MVEEAKKEVKEVKEVKGAVPPMGQQPQPTKEQMLQASFQTRLNGIITMMNDLYRDVREIVATKE
jgi:hypothetical protein